MSLNIIARKDYEDLQKNILNEKEQDKMASFKVKLFLKACWLACPAFS